MRPQSCLLKPCGTRPSQFAYASKTPTSPLSALPLPLTLLTTHSAKDVEIRNIRPTDTGPRRIVVEDYSYRLLTGLRGMHQNWDWESAVLYSLANTLDTDRNRIRADAFQAAINQTDPNLAYNPFIGGDPLNPNTGIGPRNAQSVIDTFTVDVTRESETELALWDFKVSSPDALYWYAGDIGMAAGVEFRYESYSDKRDPLLSGEIPQFDLVTGDLLSDSNALGSSATPIGERQS